MQIPALLVCLAGLALVSEGATPPAARAPAPAGSPAPKQGASAERSATPRARTPHSGAPLSDAAIEAAIKAKLAKSKIAADKFTVQVRSGVAILEGRSDVAQHKGVATRLARSAGATAVDNRIQLSESARAKAAANLQKGRRRAQIKRGEARTEDSGKEAPRR